ncbi:sigma-70 family RNA polymerase sigma factor [soil metagenome]
MDVGPAPASTDDQGEALLALYDQALPEVYGYLVARCGTPAVAEDVTSEVFLAAVDAVQRGTVPNLTVAWLIGVGRHKLVDHWRRTAREDRRLHRVAAEPDAADDDPWDAHLDAVVAHEVLASLGPHHRSALTLRYLDGLSVPEVARLLDRTVHATEALLVRARAAFRRALPDHPEEGGPDHG